MEIRHPSTMSSHTTLGAAADERKARLAKLKSLKRKQPDEPSEEEPVTHVSEPSAPDEPDVASLHLSGRNYDAETKGPKLGFEAPPTLALSKPTLEQQAAAVEAEIRRKAEEEEQEKEVDLFKLQPKKPNWDLKRDLEKKMEVLNARTDNAIASLVRERIDAVQKAARAKKGAMGVKADGEGEEAGMEGVALVEGVRVREREEEEEERRERDDEEIQ